MDFTPIHALINDSSLQDLQIPPSMKKRSGEILRKYGKYSDSSPSFKKRRREYSYSSDNDENGTDTQGNGYISAPEEEEGEEDDMVDGKEETEYTVPDDNRSSNSRESDSEESVHSFPMASTITAAIQSLPQNKEVSMAYIIIHVRNYLQKYPEATNVKKSRIATGIYESLANLTGFRKIRHGHYTYSPKSVSRKDKQYLTTTPPESSSAPPQESSTNISSKIAREYKSITYPDGSTYKGELENNKKNGKGVLNLSNGDVYTGHWKDDGIYGQGTYTKSNGDVFKGSWTNSTCGSGTLTTINGDVYTGSWKSNKISGQGKLITKDGNHYEGDWMNSLMHGEGMCRTDKHVYSGSWKNGLPNGQGKSLYNDRTKLQGEFVDGVLQNGKIFDTITNEHKNICNGIEVSHEDKSNNLPMEETKNEIAVVEVKTNLSHRHGNVKNNDKVTQQLRKPDKMMVGVNSRTHTQPVTSPTTDYESQKLLLIRIKDLFNEELITKEDYKSIKQNILKKIMEV